jgi:NitT/TauT family transport system substrate-binding protein
VIRNPMIALGILLAACASPGGTRERTAESITAPVEFTPTHTAEQRTPTVAVTPREMLNIRLGLAFTPVSAIPLSVLWLAKDLGFYEQEGLAIDLLEMPGTPTVVTALLTGDVDVGNISTEDVIKLAATRTVDLRAIHSPDARLHFLIAARDSLHSAVELRGRLFGIARVGSLDHTLTARVLHAKGINPADVQFIAIGAPTGRAQALIAGQIDATAFSLATFKAIEREPGVKILVGVDEYFAAAPIVSKVNAATVRMIRDYPEKLHRLTAAIVKASRYFAENRQAWIDAMRVRRPDIDRQDLNGLWEQFQTSWAVNGSMNLQEYQITAEFVYQSDQFKDVPRIDVRDWVDTRFVDAILKEIGVYERFDQPGRPIN